MLGNILYIFTMVIASTAIMLYDLSLSILNHYGIYHFGTNKLEQLKKDLKIKETRELSTPHPLHDILRYAIL